MKIPDEMNKITPGCLAIITGPLSKNIGRIVECIRLIPRGENFYGHIVLFDHLWEVNTSVLWMDGGTEVFIPAHDENYMIPISGDQFYTEEDKQRERDLGWLKEDLIPTGNIKDGKIKIYGVKS